MTRLAKNLIIHHGSINVGILLDGRRALLIDVGGGSMQETLRALGVESVAMILCTHHHRDQVSGVYQLLDRGTQLVVPLAEKPWFTDVEAYWANPAHRWHLYDFRPHNLMLAQSVSVHQTVQAGDTLIWGDAKISVIGTPGHTDGSVSYLVALGETRYVFCGDVIYDAGQIWELYSLQKGYQTRDYHGFMGDRERLEESLQKLHNLQVDALIPSHGNIMRDPAHAIDLLYERLDRCYETYAAISALRYYFPELFEEFEGREDMLSQGRTMPIQPSFSYPDFLRHMGTSWIVSSEDGPAFVLDCGDPRMIHLIQALQARGDLGEIAWLWITHYHDDHVDALPAFQEAFECPIVAHESVAMVVEEPLAWRLPCISPVKIDVDRCVYHKETWAWHEFTLTAYHLPGQTRYHGGLLVEGRGARIFFVGDSFTPLGIDDYCAGNRNFLGEGVGFDACLALVQELTPDYILNCHVDVGFTFSDEVCALMRANLAERERLYGALLPWDHPNYGMDEHWVRCHPYEQHVAPGSTAQLDVVFTNHSNKVRETNCYPVLPVDCSNGQHWEHVPPQRVRIPPKTEGHARFVFGVPPQTPPGRYVVPIDVVYQQRHLGQFREAILVISQ
jgi:glyoxylase-like metal-dependent hydrolase (beta-lactamase superfamily II)